MTKPIKPSLNIPEGFAANGTKTDFEQEKIQNGFDPVDPDVLAGDNLNKFIDDTYKGLNYTVDGVTDLYKGLVVYDENEVYNLNSLVFHIEDEGVALYQSLIADNTGNQLTDTTKWKKLELGSGGMSIGTLFPSFATSDYVPEYALPCDGSEYSGAQFPSLWSDYLTAATPKLLTCTYEEFQQEITQHGKCAKFAIDETNSKFKTPYIPDGTFIQQAMSEDEAGKVYNAGLPNITGSVANDMLSYQIVASGAFNIDQLGTQGAQGSSSYGRWGSFSFDASRVSDVYGNSSTVQPEAIALRWFVVVANASENESAMDWSQWATTLGAKANVDGDNFSAVGKSNITGFAMPGNKIINLTLGESGATYTAPANGWFVLNKTAGRSGEFIGMNTDAEGNSGVISMSRAPGAFPIQVSCPIAKGEKLLLMYSASGETMGFYFVYAQGEEVEE